MPPLKCIGAKGLVSTAIMAHSYYCVMATCLYAYLLSISIVYVSMSSRTTPTSRNSDKFVLRMPDGMRDTIAELAKQSGRSMNAEIVYRLQQSIEQEVTDENPVDGVHVMEFKIANQRLSGSDISEALRKIEDGLKAVHQVLIETDKETGVD